MGPQGIFMFPEPEKYFKNFPIHSLFAFFLEQKLPLGPMCEPLISFGNGRSMELTRNKIESDNKKKVELEEVKVEIKEVKMKRIERKRFDRTQGHRSG